MKNRQAQRLVASTPRINLRRLSVRAVVSAIFAIGFGAPGCDHGSIVGSCLGLQDFTNCRGGPVDESVPCGNVGSGGGGGSIPTTCHTAKDCPPSSTVCATATCEKRTCSFADAAKGHSCEDHGGKQCDGDGSCVECLATSDCAKATACVKAECSAAHTCGTGNERSGTACSDHGGSVCDGLGKCVVCNAKSDCAAPATACETLASCTDHECKFDEADEGTTCSDHGGNLCDGSGHCFGAALATAAESHACALTTLGDALCWGINGEGEVGDGSTTQRPTAVDVTGLSSVSQIASGYYHTCALTSAGGMKCWGANVDGQLGTGSKTAEPSPTDVVGLSSGVHSIAAYGPVNFVNGELFGDTCAVLKAGTVECWGTNLGGKFGAGAPAAGSSPFEVAGLTAISEVALGGRHLCALDASGGVHCLGTNTSGQLGDTTTTNRSSPVTPHVGFAGTSTTAIAAGDTHTCALANGTVWCWGSNASGQLGISGGYTEAAQPMDTLFSAIALVAGASHTCALNAAGQVYCWGLNNAGQLGNGTTSNAMLPTEVTGLPAAAAKIAAGNNETCAVLRDGRMTCWGAKGGLGDGSGMDQHEPVVVSGL